MLQIICLKLRTSFLRSRLNANHPETCSEGDGQKFSPGKISCSGKNSPLNAPQKTAVICHLSSIPIISTCFEPFTSIVHDDPGTMLIPVWSQLKINSGGTASISTTALMSRRNCSFTASKFSTVIFVVKLALCLTKLEKELRPVVGDHDQAPVLCQ